MKTFSTTSLGLLLLLNVGCVHQHVTESVEEQAVIEGRRFASEMEAQSPFEAVEISWREAQGLMKERNPAYRAAKAGHAEALEQTPLVEELTDHMKDVVGISLGDLIKPDKLAQTMQLPVTLLPKQLASISKLKDLSHEMEQDTWVKMEKSVTHELKMREQEVKLHRLLRSGGLIDREIACLDGVPPVSTDADPKLLAARKKWHDRLDKERDAWLDEVRDFFDAEYHDVVFTEDGSGFPTYEGSKTPKLSEWSRWGRLRRSQELVDVLQEAHKKSKPSVPGSRMVTSRLGGLLGMDLGEGEVHRKPSSVRTEVRALISNWREMKEAQEKARQLEASSSGEQINSIALVGERQTIYELRQTEIKHASVVWMMDEDCWRH